MSEVISVQPTGEPKETLFSGARIFNPDPTTGEAWIELPLSIYYQQDPTDLWRLAGAALIEARRLGYTSPSMGHPSSLVGEVRRWFRDNYNLNYEIQNPDQMVWLVVRPGRENLLFKRHDDHCGMSEYVPINRWSIKVIPK